MQLAELRIVIATGCKQQIYLSVCRSILSETYQPRNGIDNRGRLDFKSLSSLFTELFNSPESPGDVRMPRSRGLFGSRGEGTMFAGAQERTAHLGTNEDWMDGLHVGSQGLGRQPSWSSQQGPGRWPVPHKSISNEILVQGDANRLANNHTGLNSKLSRASAGALQVRAPIWTWRIIHSFIHS